MAAGIDTNAVPGTVTLLDLQHVMPTRHLDKGNHEIVLIPTPSDDPDDPLNWSSRRKLLLTICVNVYVLVRRAISYICLSDTIMNFADMSGFKESPLVLFTL